MIEINYVDSYGVERHLEYADYDAMMLALSGCITIPDYLKVSSVLYDGKDIGYQGLVGELYQTMSTFDFTPYQ